MAGERFTGFPTSTPIVSIISGGVGFGGSVYESEGDAGGGSSQPVEAQLSPTWQSAFDYVSWLFQAAIDVQGGGTSSVRLGLNSSMDGNNNIVIGEGSSATGDNDTVVGQGSAATGDKITVVGQGSTATKDEATIVGEASSITGENGTAVGYGIAVAGDNNTLVGNVVSDGGYDSVVVMGFGASVGGNSTVAIGPSASAGAIFSIAIGSGSSADAGSSVALGVSASADGIASTALGQIASADFTGSIAIGSQSTCTAARQLVIGSAFYIDDIYLGEGVVAEALFASSVTINATGRDGEDLDGKDLILAGGKGTGDGDGGSVFIKTAPPGSSGETLNSLSTVVEFSGSAESIFSSFVIINNGFALIVGNGSQIAAGEVTSTAQILGTTETDASLVINLASTTNALAPQLKFVKTAAAGIGTFTTAVADNEELGKIQAYGSDGTDADTLAAEIAFNVDDAGVGTGTIGGEIVIATATTGGTLTAAMRVNSSQQVLIGTSAADAAEKLRVESTISSVYGLVNIYNTNSADEGQNVAMVLRLNVPQAGSTNSRFISFWDKVTNEVGKIRINDSAVGYDTTSDERLKTLIGPSSLGLDELLKISVNDFYWNGDPEKRTVQGFFAQQLYRVYPWAVGVGGDDPSENPWSTDYGRITPLLAKAIQESVTEHRAEISRLERRIEELEAT